MIHKYFAYAIYSALHDKIYIGFSTDPQKRLIGHNSSINHGWTSRYKPWKLIYVEECETKKQAMAREKQLKTAKGREYIRGLIRS